MDILNHLEESSLKVKQLELLLDQKARQVALIQPMSMNYRILLCGLIFNYMFSGNIFEPKKIFEVETPVETVTVDGLIEKGYLSQLGTRLSLEFIEKHNIKTLRIPTHF